MKNTVIYVIRHGETEENAKKVFQGQTPGTLSPQGIEQAAALRRQIAEIQYDKVLCSDLKRCKDTAAIALEGTGITPIYTELLRERYLGNLTGLPMEGAVLNETVESDEAVRKRAEEFLKNTRRDYKGCTLLVFSHGFFCRIMQGVIEGVSHREVPIMSNCEIRRFEI